MDTADSPYKFLDWYELEDAHLFFGRELETKVLLADIITTRLVVLFAKTGTGKTSLINAGVRPFLHERGYQTFFIRVEDDPVRSARSVIEEELGHALTAGEEFAAQLEGLAETQPIVLFFDQFEEFFLYVARESPTKARRFVSDIARVYENEASGVHVVFSLREEFLAEMEIFRDDIPTIFATDSNLRLRWFNPNQAASAIESPAGVFNTSVEPGLVEKLVADLTAIGLSIPGTNRETPIEPAQLQIVCDTIWRERADSSLTLEGYLALAEPGHEDNVAQQILDQRLVEEFERLESEAELDLLWRLLPELHTERGTKWVRELRELARTVGTDEESLRSLLKQLQHSGLVDIVSRETAEFVEFVHDYLAEPRRVEVMRRAVHTIWPRKLIQRAREANRLLEPHEIGPVQERLEELELAPAEAEVILRSALAEPTADVSRILKLLADQRVDAWEVCRERLVAGDDVEAEHVVTALAKLGDPEGLDILAGAFEAQNELARRIVSTLGDVSTTDAVELVARALEYPSLRAEAQVALARLTKASVAPRAIALLEGQELSPEAQEELLLVAASRHEAIAGRVLPLLARIEQPRAVELLAMKRENETLELVAETALRSLERSSNDTVATAARAAVRRPKGRVERSRPPLVAPEPVMQRERSIYPEEFDRHMRSVVRGLSDGRVVLFLGAGVNLLGRPAQAAWGRDAPYLPSGAELTSYLADRFGYPTDEPIDLPRVADYVAAVVGQGPLYDELRTVYESQTPPTPLHELIASLPAHLRTRGVFDSLLIVSTNFDDLLERALEQMGEPYDVVFYMASATEGRTFWHRSRNGLTQPIEAPNTYTGLGSDGIVILKLAGSVSASDSQLDSFVVSQEDYVDYLARAELTNRVPVSVTAKLRVSSFLFLGYSLRDWNQRALLRPLWGGQKLTFTSWAVVYDPSLVEQAIWQRWRVDLLDVPLGDYVERLRDALINLSEAES